MKGLISEGILFLISLVICLVLVVAPIHWTFSLLLISCTIVATIYFFILLAISREEADPNRLIVKNNEILSKQYKAELLHLNALMGSNNLSTYERNQIAKKLQEIKEPQLIALEDKGVKDQ